MPFGKKNKPKETENNKAAADNTASGADITESDGQDLSFPDGVNVTLVGEVPQ